MIRRCVQQQERREPPQFRGDGPTQLVVLDFKNRESREETQFRGNLLGEGILFHFQRRQRGHHREFRGQRPGKIDIVQAHREHGQA